MTESVERQRLRQVVASPSSRVTAEYLGKLATVSADALVDLVLDGDEPWWRRRVCARALAGRVPGERARALVDCVRDAGVTTEVRKELLVVLSTVGGPHTEVLLSWLRAQEGVLQPPMDLDAAVLQARARLGDTSVAGPLAVLAADPCSHRRTEGEQAIDGLIQVRGRSAVLAALGADSARTLATSVASPALRLLGLRLTHRAGADITFALADSSPIVARKAYELLADTSGDDEVLVEMVTERRPGHLWALAVLHRRGHAIRHWWEALGEPRVELPTVPGDVRQAIVREYIPGERETDPRWLVEAACLDQPDGPDERQLLDRATEALAAAGLHPQAPVSAAEEYQQGHGTYHTIRTDAGTVTVSTLGRFFSISGDDARVVAAMHTAGFRHINAELAKTRFTGLHVYFFGDREPLCVGDLLFYWQD